jgi:hypothetical protein
MLDLKRDHKTKNIKKHHTHKNSADRPICAWSNSIWFRNFWPSYVCRVVSAPCVCVCVCVCVRIWIMFDFFPFFWNLPFLYFFSQCQFKKRKCLYLITLSVSEPGHGVGANRAAFLFSKKINKHTKKKTRNFLGYWSNFVFFPSPLLLSLNGK